MDEAFDGADIVYPKSWAPCAAMEERAALHDRGDADGIRSLEQPDAGAERPAPGLDGHRRPHGARRGTEAPSTCTRCPPTSPACRVTRARSDAEVFDRHRVSLYAQASNKPYAIAAMIFLQKVSDPVARLHDLSTAPPRAGRRDPDPRRKGRHHMPQIDYVAVRDAAEGYRADMVAFLRALIRTPGTSCHEEAKARLVVAEMERLGYTSTRIDGLGSAVGTMGTGETLIAFDGHIDTVGVGNPANWTFDPFEGFEDDVLVGGRGASDQLGGVVSAVYGGRIAKDVGLLSDAYTCMVTGTVQEEDCDGLCWLYLIEEEGALLAFVVSTEATDGGIYRGHRGRMEIRVDVAGVSCHGSAPERGDNAIYKMAEILLEVRDLDDRLPTDPFLGKGTVTTSEIFATSPSRCAVADGCWVSLDRRLTDGETWQGALHEVEELPSVRKHGATVSCYDYRSTAWTGTEYGQQCYFPTWVIPEDAREVRAAATAHRAMFRRAAHRQVDVLHERRGDRRAARHPRRGRRAGQGGAGPRSGRGAVEGRPRHVRRDLQRAADRLLRPRWLKGARRSPLAANGHEALPCAYAECATRDGGPRRSTPAGGASLGSPRHQRMPRARLSSCEE